MEALERKFLKMFDWVHDTIERMLEFRIDLQEAAAIFNVNERQSNTPPATTKKILYTLTMYWTTLLISQTAYAVQKLCSGTIADYKYIPNHVHH